MQLLWIFQLKSDQRVKKKETIFQRRAIKTTSMTGKKTLTVNKEFSFSQQTVCFIGALKSCSIYNSPGMFYAK